MVDRLKDRVKELEEKLQSLSLEALQNKQSVDEAQPTPPSASLPVNLDPLAEHGGNKKYYNWDFVSTGTTRATQQCYGPSSSFYFIGQMTTYLDAADHQQHQGMGRSDCFRGSFLSCSGDLECIVFKERFRGQGQPFAEHDLSRSQEELFLNLYWQIYHDIYPILNKEEFNAHYAALWDTTKALRQPSALVDIVLALCMQWEAGSNIAILYPERSSTGDATMAGHWFHRRCQYLLTDELEEPSIRTFQCYLLSVLWLSTASLHNMAHSVLAAGIRTGIILGLHIDPPDSLPTGEREFRKRLWWTMYVLEMKFAMELGRPLAVNFSQVTCGLPGDCELVPDHDEQASRPPSFNTQFLKLFLSTRAIYITFYSKCGEVLGKSGHKTLYHDQENLEICAKFLSKKISYLQAWLQQVPGALRPKRRNRGQSFSTDRSELDISSSADDKIARQSLYLELLYHDLSMSLYRPFIAFSKSTRLAGSETEKHAISSVNHAITITSIIHQVLNEKNYLNGWHETFRWQWNAALSLIGFILAFPGGPNTSSARKALGTVLSTFQLLSKNMPSAARAATLIRDLAARTDVLISSAEASLLGSTMRMPSIASSSDLSTPEIDGLEFGVDVLVDPTVISKLGGDERQFQNTLASSSGFAFTSDSFSGLGDIDMDDETMLEFLDFGTLGDL